MTPLLLLLVTWLIRFRGAGFARLAVLCIKEVKTAQHETHEQRNDFRLTYAKEIS